LSRFFRSWVSVAAIVITVAWSAVAWAQTATRVIDAIRVEGNQRIEPETVVSYMGLAIGDKFDSGRIDRALKSLFASGLFADVTIRREGNTLIVKVVENPIINRLAFEGNKRIKDDALAAETQLRPRVVYTRTKVQNDVARIVEIYRRSGRFAATVEPKVIQLEQNRVDLVFEINEGPITKVKRINFIGNKHFSDNDLRDVIQTKEAAWYRFLTSDDTYDPDRLTFDRELLRRFYLSKGYADFRTESAVAELTRDRSGFFVTFTINEGRRYRFGKIDVASELRGLDTASLDEAVQPKEGDWYDADLIENTVQKLTDKVGTLGYAFVDVKPKTQRHRDKRTVDLTFDIAEGPRVFVERINITGNFRTLDEVIRREFQLVEGDAFNAAKIRRSRQRIRNLGFFETVEVNNRVGSAPDKAVIDVAVTEKSTGDLSFGAGLSSLEGVLADVKISERNLLGRGQNLSSSFTISGRRQEIDLSFTEPYFLDRDLAAGFDLFRRSTDLTNRGTFDQKSVGTTLRMNYPLFDRLRQSVRYTIRRDRITNIDFAASRFIREQRGTRVTSGIGQTLSYDVRDSRFDPTKGFIIRLEQDLAGLGGPTRFLRQRLTGSIFFPLTEDLVARFATGAGYVFGFGGSDVRINDRFFIGGKTLRGFNTAGIGPRDAISNDALGGNAFVTGTAELSFPLGFPSEFDVKGRVFTDAGTLTNNDDQGSELLDVASLRLAVGFGLSYTSPLGPILIDFAVPILREPFDERQSVRFSVGTRF